MSLNQVISKKTSAQLTEEKTDAYLQETQEFVKRLKNNLFNKILGEQQTKKSQAASVQSKRTDYLVVVK